MSIISFYVCSFDYRKAIDLHNLFVYSDILMYLLIDSLVLVEFRESLMYSVISFANRNIDFFLYLNHFNVFFFGFIPSAMISSKILKRNGDSAHLCFFLNFNIITFNYSQFRRMLAVGFSYIAFIVLICVEVCFL